MKRIKYTTLAAGLVVSGTLSGFELLQHFWVAGDFSINAGNLCTTGPGNCSGQGDNYDWVAAFQTSGSRWNNATNDFFVDVTPNTVVDTCEFNDPNAAFFSDIACDSAFGGGTLARARTFFNQDDEALHTDVIFNNAELFGVYDGPHMGFPGDRTDLTRVGVHELGHSIGLDHPVGHPEAIMHFQVSDTIAPQQDDIDGVTFKYGDPSALESISPAITALNDVNGNSAADFAVALDDANGDPTIYVKDGSTGNDVVVQGGGSAGLNSIDPAPGSTILGLDRVPDMNQNGADEIAALFQDPDDTIKARVYDGSTGNTLSTVTFAQAFTPVDFAVVPDIDGQSRAALVRLGIDAQGNVRAQVKAADNGALIRNVQFAPSFPPEYMVVIPDVTGNNVSDLAVLGIDASGNVRVQLKDSLTGNLLHWIQYAKAFIPQTLIMIPNIDGADTPALAVLGIHADGRVRLQIKNAATRTPALADRVSFGGSYQFREMVVIPDFSGNAIAETGYLGVDGSGTVRLQIKDPSTKTLLSQVFFSKTFPPDDIAVINDVNGVGAADVGVLGENQNNGNNRVQIKDSSTLAEVSTIFIP